MVYSYWLLHSESCSGFADLLLNLTLALLGWVRALTYQGSKGDFFFNRSSFCYNGSNGHPSVTAWCGGVLPARSRCHLPPVRRRHLQPLGCFQVRPSYSLVITYFLSNNSFVPLAHVWITLFWILLVLSLQTEEGCRSEGSAGCLRGGCSAGWQTGGLFEFETSR